MREKEMCKLGKYLAAGMVVLGSVIANASQAEAVVYEFSNYNPGNGDVTANGFFDLSTAPGDTIDWANDVNSFSITLSGPGGDFILDDLGQITLDTLSTASVAADGLSFDWGLVPGNGSLSAGGLEIEEEIEVDGLTFDNFFYVDSSWAGLLGLEQLSLNFSLNQQGSSVRFSQPGEPYGGGFLATAVPTAVPFEVSPTMGILAIGGIWGVSRLRKRIAARKLDKLD